MSPKSLGPYRLVAKVPHGLWRSSRLRDRQQADMRARKLQRLGYRVVLTGRDGVVLYTGEPRNG